MKLSFTCWNLLRGFQSFRVRRGGRVFGEANHSGGDRTRGARRGESLGTRRPSGSKQGLSHKRDVRVRAK